VTPSLIRTRSDAGGYEIEHRMAGIETTLLAGFIVVEKGLNDDVGN
jgi:hypothetical protein